ncbi:MAG: tRNA threonylcarbamoyl adenosine modification protein (Sua5/YciO/YrdC/YwlC family) [Bacteroidia bacterium]|jgi:tRNA threonylcarbamoyl adenosine modification protein (Sua5/YciO/YrdC/YwlC family)|tara:strand:- start:2186 stop:2806 length:621 start_codon:yes stop_codon:yes gene_type:complete
MSEFVEIRPHNINAKTVREIVQVLRKGGLAIIPTDSIYAIVGDLYHREVMDKVCKLIDQKPNKANLSILCKDLSNLSEYTSPIPNPTYKLMKRVLPGPFTFILKANNNIPKIFRQNKKTIGIRVPDNAICQAIVAELGNPLVSSSIHSEDEIQEYLTEPEEIFELWNGKVEYIIDGEAGSNIGTTVIDASEGELELVREGLGIEKL